MSLLSGKYCDSKANYSTIPYFVQNPIQKIKPSNFFGWLMSQNLDLGMKKQQKSLFRMTGMTHFLQILQILKSLLFGQ